MTSVNYRQFGLFPAINHPIVAPTVTCDATPASGLIVSDEWIPIVTGFIKQLLKDAYWLGTPGQIDFALEQVDLLVSSWQFVIAPGEPANWDHHWIDDSDEPSYMKQLTGFPGITGDYGWKSAVYAFPQPSEPPVPIHAKIGFISQIDSTQVGVYVYDFEVESSTPGDIIAGAWVDCLGILHTIAGAYQMSYADIFGTTVPVTVRYVELMCETEDLSIFIQCAGVAQCGVA